MAHYAFLDENSVVTEVIVGRDETDLPEGIASWEDYYGAFRGQVCKRTSYNTQYVYEYEYDDSEPPQVISATIVGSIHTQGGIPFRGKYAGIGDIYDAVNDVFVSPEVTNGVTPDLSDTPTTDNSEA